MTVPNLPVAISDAPWSTLPYELPSIRPNLKTVTVVSCLSFIAHETEECHVNWSHAELECFEVEAEILAETMENLIKKKKQEIIKAKFRHLTILNRNYHTVSES